MNYMNNNKLFEPGPLWTEVTGFYRTWSYLGQLFEEMMGSCPNLELLRTALR